MSDSHDQSYYEIALTNRQVLSIFVGLLVCILMSFLGGVWLGQNADASVKVASTQSIVATDSGDAPLERLDFFSRSDDAKAAEPEAGVAADQPNELPKNLERTADSGADSTRPADRRPAQPRASATTPARETSSEPAPAEATADPVVIQVFSSNEEAQAQRVVDELRARGYPALLSPVDVEGRILHRVRIGPYTDRDEAEVVARSVQRAFKLETWITN